MMDTEPIFRYRTPNAEKLAAYGFRPDGGGVSKTIPILQGTFEMAVTVAPEGAVRFQVLESATGEEYVLVHVGSARGGFVGDVRVACEKELRDIAGGCFDTETFRAEQARRILARMKAELSAEPEFLWKQYPGDAAFRRPDNQKWFAVMLTVERKKLGLDGSGNIEIIDLKATPSDVRRFLADPRFNRAYHMNKTHWFAVCLDGRVPDKELIGLIAESRRLAE